MERCHQICFPIIWEFLFKKIFLFIYLAPLGLSCGMWALISQPGDQTRAPCIGNSKSQQVDHQGSPRDFSFFHSILVVNPPTNKNTDLVTARANSLCFL